MAVQKGLVKPIHSKEDIMESVLLDVAGHPAHRRRCLIPPRTPATEQGRALPGRPSHRRGDHRCNARCLRSGRRTTAPVDRAALARRAADRRSARSPRERSRQQSRRDSGAARQGRQAPRGRNGPLAWRQLEPWQQTRSGLPVGALLCVIHGPTAGRHWEPSAARKQLRHAALAARFAPHNSDTRTRSKWRTKASHSSSSNVSSGTPTSASRASTYKESTAPRSSTPSTDARPR